MIQGRLLVFTFCLFLPLFSFTQSFVSLNLKGYAANSYLFLSKGPLNDEIYHRGRGENLIWSGEPMSFHFDEKDHPLQVHISFGRGQSSQSIPLIIFPGDSLAVTVDLSLHLPGSDQVHCEISGPNAAGQEFLYRHEYYPPVYYMDQLEAIIENAPADEMPQALQEEYARRLKPLDEMLAADEINEPFHQWARGIVETPLLSRSVTLLYGKQEEEFDQLTEGDRQRITAWLFEQYPPLEAHRLYGRQGTLYAKHYFSFQRAKDLGLTHFMGLPDSVIQRGNEELVLQDVFPALLRIPDPELKEFIFAETLVAYFQVLVGDQSWLEKYLDLFYDLYPDSRYEPALDWSYGNNANVRQENLLNMQKPAAPSGAVAAPASTERWSPEMMSEQWELSDLRLEGQDRLSGKDLYVTVWSTSCQACLEDISYQAQTDALLAANDVERLYISLDRDEEEWSYMIFDLHIGGYHVRAGDLLREQLAAELGLTEAPLETPYYFLVKSGSIVEKSAAGPGQLEKLQQQIARYFGN